MYSRTHHAASLQVAVFADTARRVPTRNASTPNTPYWGVFFLLLTDKKLPKTPKNSHEKGGIIPENSHERALLYTKLPNTLRRWIFTFHRLFYAPSLQCPTEIAATLRAILREAVAVSKQ
jgi:hypothetical protein